MELITFVAYALLKNGTDRFAKNDDRIDFT